MKNIKMLRTINGSLRVTLLCGAIAALSLISSGCENTHHQPGPEELIQITTGIKHNYLTENCPTGTNSCFHATISITLPENMPKDWRIMFSNLVPINQVESQYFNLVHINGDLHQISAKTLPIVANTVYEIQFFGTSPLISESVLFPNYILVGGDDGAKVITSTIELLRQGHQLPRSQHIVPFTTPQQLLRGPDDQIAIADATERFNRFSSRRLKDKTSDPHHRIIPKLYRSSWSTETVRLESGVQLPNLDDLSIIFSDRMRSAIKQRFQQNELAVNSDGMPISLEFATNRPAESYALLIKPDAIQIKYADSAGLYYAMMSIAQLYDQEYKTLPIGTADDHPDLAFRGLHIDVSRNFRDKAFILKALDQMSYYKLNKLHLHLADDEGWRLQIDSLPELTQVGGFRCVDETEQSCLLPMLASGNGQLQSNQQNNGYFSIADYVEILQYAQARHIEILPSLDMPGHSRAAIVAMNARYDRLMLENRPTQARQYLLTEFADSSNYRSIQHYNDNTLNPCIASTYAFVEEVLVQLNAMHMAAGVPLKHYHIGADETAGAWANSPACAALIAENEALDNVQQLGSYFIEKVTHTVSRLDIVPAAWSDGLSHANKDNLPTNVQANAWETLHSGGHNKAHKMINNGWNVVLSTPDVLYFDFPYEADPVEPGYFWASRFTDTYQIFQFMPRNLPVHAEIWKNNFGQNYAANANIDIQNEGQIEGIQAQLWSETVRSNAVANYMLFPRLLAVAERAWHSPGWKEDYQPGVSYTASTGHFDLDQQIAMHADWQSFSYVLATKAMPQLVKDGVNPRVPLPGAVWDNGELKLISNLSGLVLEFKTANQQWQRFEQPIQVSNNTAISIRSRIPRTQVTSREQLVSEGSL